MGLSITGSTGTIGRHIPPGVKKLKLDLSALQEDTVAGIIEQEDTILHLAGVVGPAKVNEKPEFAKAVNIDGTAVLAGEFIKKSSGKFYYVSTSHVYAPTSEIITEASEIGPSSLYAEQKMMAEKVLSEIFSNEPSRLCIIRVFSVLDWNTGPYSLGGAVHKVATGELGYVLRNASDIRDFLTPKTIAEALFKIASAGEMSGVTNLCSSQGTTVGDATIRMLSESGYEIPPNVFEWERSHNPVVIGDNSRLKAAHPELDLVWQPTSFKQHGKNHQVR